ncbi:MULTISPECIES: winged helix-turn-helix domain-containing protein [unclassified Novosphingobium]|uniref:ATP-binding protein n=1 Tax=unclassified Novosphingobium TaxID=2644732 RepID=UPI00146DB35E|nr:MULTISPECIES: winged helix-turn-helix domain-containing protein [unclassified Novosphingobium]NMN07357.1 putative ATPase/DNA-binding winged helix-turn-helix (wHTH) protein/tetratricopeptide (TPR) repeat protein [Novosphingobium sp. SG919]NMN89666.1 putative ATPase/DNA-binding winged helix-turn-helix (wHTH) protein/tetratricopeptide (TPR) repeat protein [Novosphingobium sp. SG916]
MNFPAVEEFTFGRFRLFPERQMLLRDEEPVRLGSRATEILSLLVRHAGALVSKAQIMEKVWPDTTVVEANLSVHMSALRRALTDDTSASPYIVTVPGRGYRFTAAVGQGQQDRPVPEPAAARSNNLPLLLTRLIGRSDALQALNELLASQRLVTVVGTGGVGKTALALNVAERKLANWRDGVWIADLASLADADMVPAAIATVLGLEVRSTNPVPALISALADKQMLLLLDNCEHVIEAAAMIAHAILQSARSVTILATSREPFTIPGEHVLRLDPLGVPPETELVGAREALHYAAIELLSERAAAVESSFALGDEDALAASLICRKLGGVPLAIEFASALVPIFGLRGLATRLDDRLRLLGGHRNVQARHRTITAALDWSYQLLAPEEQRALRRLAVFAGGFSIEAANAVLGPGMDEETTAEIISRLVLKSLVSPDVRDANVRFRLLETTRAFALDVLEAAREGPQVSRLHAEYFARVLHGEGSSSPANDDYAAFVPELDNIRAALRWAMSPSGDVTTALAIGAGALPIWFGLSLLTECGTRMTALMDGLDPLQRQTPHGAAIDIAIQATGIFTFGAPDGSYRDWTERERIAADGNLLIERVRLLLGRWTYNIRMPDYALADEQSRALIDIAEAQSEPPETGEAPLALLVDPAHMHATAAWARGTTLHHMGEMAAARACLERFLLRETPQMRAFFMTITGFDRRSDVLGLLSIAKCLQGEVDQGLADAAEAVREARATRKALPICEALQWACFSMVLMGEPSSATSILVGELLGTAKTHSLNSHYGVALGLKGCLIASSGQHERAIELLRSGLGQLNEAHYGPFDPFFTGVLASSLSAIGELREAQHCVARFEMDRQTPHGFCGPDLTRRRALLAALAGQADLAERLLRAAIDEAIEQGTLLWRLRAGRDLAALYEAQERQEAADAERQKLSLPATEPLRSREAQLLW